MTNTTIYTTSAVSTGEGRSGHVRSIDGLLDLDLALPKEFGGSGRCTNPEQLFAAGYAACFHSALKLVASKEKVSLGESVVSAQINVHPAPETGFRISVNLNVDIKGLTQPVAESLVAQAHRICPYSNAIRGNVDGRLETSDS